MLGFIPLRILSYCGAFIVNTSIRYIKNRHKPIFAGYTVVVVVILVFQKSEYSGFKGRCFLLWT